MTPWPYNQVLLWNIRTVVFAFLVIFMGSNWLHKCQHLSSKPDYLLFLRLDSTDHILQGLKVRNTDAGQWVRTGEWENMGTPDVSSLCALKSASFLRAASGSSCFLESAHAAAYLELHHGSWTGRVVPSPHTVSHCPQPSRVTAAWESVDRRQVLWQMLKNFWVRL